MSDRIAVFNDGRIEQVAHPRGALREPRPPPFVAGFVGTSNLLTGEAARGRPRPRRHVQRPAREAPRSTPDGASGADEATAGARCARSSTSARSPTTSSSSTPARASPCSQPEPPGSSDRRRSSRATGRVARGLAPRARHRPLGDTTAARHVNPGETVMNQPHASSPRCRGARARGRRLLRRLRRRSDVVGSTRPRRRAASPPPDVPMQQSMGDDRGLGQHPGLAGLRRGRLQRQDRRLGDAVREGDRLPGERQVLRHLRRGRQPDEDRRVRRGVGLGRRVAAPHRRR